MMRSRISLLILASLIVSCSDSGTSLSSRDFNMKFSYGIRARNVLNTFGNIYTKDLILDGTITVPLTLSDDELQRISAKMHEIDFFSYPEHFGVPAADTMGFITLCSTYDFEVSYESTIKRLHWSDSVTSEDTAALKLRELIVLITDIIKSKREYSQLPSARGGYL